MEKGIEELTEFVVFVGVLVTASDKATENGLGMDDIALYMESMMKAPAALTGLDEARLEAADLTMDELKVLNGALATALDLRDDQLEGLVERILTIAVELYAIFKAVKVLKA